MSPSKQKSRLSEQPSSSISRSSTVGGLKSKLTSSRPNTIGLIIFILVFAVLGAKLIFFSHASGLPPTVSITVPTNNALVCGGATTISASATDNSGSGLNNVQFKLDGTALGSAVTSSPYNYSWDNWITDAATSGSHALTATATDNDTNATTSNSINVVISEPGDVDCDGTVSGHDLSILLANYSLSYPAAEFDGGSTVTGHDLSILLTNYGKSVTLPPTNSALPTISGTDTEGDTLTATNGTWNNSPTSYTYQWQDCDSSGNNCANISTATSSSYVLQSTDVNDTIRVVVTATNAGGSEPATSGQTGVVVASGGGSTVVGALGETTPACTVTAGSATAIVDDITNAAAGAVVCIANGSYAGIDMTASGGGATSATGTFTVRAQNPGGVTVTQTSQGGCLYDPYTLNHALIEGLYCDGGNFILRGNHSNDTFQYNTMEHDSCSGEGCSNLAASFYSYANSNGNGTAANIIIQYNQMDNDQQCVEIDSSAASNWTFSHNVCGPTMGGNDGSMHYIQVGGVSTFTIDNNLFTGPLSAGALADHTHTSYNVIHGDGGGSNWTISNNIMWQPESGAQDILLESGSFSNLTITNNLFNEVSSPYPAYSIYLGGLGSPTFTGTTTLENNTCHGGADGCIHFASTPSNSLVENNVCGGLGGGSCFNSGSTFTGNWADDGSGNNSWTAAWQNTSWTPASGSPYSAPPPTLYLPTAGTGEPPTSAGYQGPVGP